VGELLSGDVQGAIDSSAELTAFQTFGSTYKNAIKQAKSQPLNSHYKWSGVEWTLVETLSGATTYEFNDDTVMTVDPTDKEDASLRIESPDFTYLMSAEAPNGFPSGTIYSASLGKWGVGKGVSPDFFGSIARTILRFPGGSREENEDESQKTVKLAYLLPHAKATLYSKEIKGSAPTVEILLNNKNRCASSEPVLEAAFPDVWSRLQLY
jgi:hypothetical protein